MTARPAWSTCASGAFVGFLSALLSLSSGSVSPAAAAGPQASKDQQFVDKAAQGGMAEVKLGNLAEEKAENDEVEDFGETMIEDHADANDELRDIAEDQGFSVPDAMSDDAQQAYDRLSALSGAEFDRRYIEHMVEDHQKDIEIYQLEAEEGQNEELRDFVEETLPMLREHLERAKELQSELGQ